jgi:hypothetical protein
MSHTSVSSYLAEAPATEQSSLMGGPQKQSVCHSHAISSYHLYPSMICYRWKVKAY